MKKSVNRESGFVMLLVLVLGVVVTAGFFLSFSFKKIIDQETRLANLRHTGYLIEDTLRTAISMKARNPVMGVSAAQIRLEIIAMVKNFAQINNPTSYIKMPIPGSNCSTTSNAVPCNVLVKKVLFTNDLGFSVAESLATRAVLEIKSEKLNSAGGTLVLEEHGAGTEEFIVPLPRESTIRQSQQLNIGRTVCSVDTPLFLGTEIVKVGNSQELRARCAAIPTSIDARISCASIGGGSGCQVQKVNCNVNEGYWLTGLEPSLAPNCRRFPEGTGINTSVVSLCEGGQVATGFKFNNKFQVSDIVCRSKGGPYDFEN